MDFWHGLDVWWPHIGHVVCIKVFGVKFDSTSINVCLCQKSM